MNERSVDVRNGEFQVDVLEGDSGDPLLFLHGVAGLEWTPFLERLSANHTVIAPRTPGFGESTGSEKLHDIHDLVMFYLDLLDELELDHLPLVGHSLGGMFAAELAAVQPGRFTHTVLASPFGLWDDASPVVDLFAISLEELAAAMYADAESDAAVAIATAPQARMTEVDPDTEEGQATIHYLVERAKSMSTAAKYLWPIPNRGLSKRLHRVTQPTLIIWGESDGIIPASYASQFASAIPNATAQLISNAAHMVIEEQPDQVVQLIEGLLSK
ncbi:MAG TPA: alpha/beta hydrolase [Dehalococcoidia bacterium]|jgi:pimeloyl-ACP methyl ester carboxylesterase|nr:alpha/beta hydrolase [Dehalococcoidia bacterium]HIK90124.1 alpha/beta hydrolase [Dehalococcoidia bacterium]